LILDGVEVRDRLTAARPEAVRDPVTGEPGMHIRLLAPDGTVLEDRHSATTKDLFSGAFARLELTAEIGGLHDVDVGVIGVGDWHVTVGDAQSTAGLHASGRAFSEETVAPPTALIAQGVPSGTKLVATVDVIDRFGDGGVWGSWGLAVHPQSRSDDELISAAEAAAREADVAVVVVGLTEERETETIDKTTLALPGRQDEMVKRVAASARRTVVVVNAATPVLMPWLDDVDAVLWAGLPGQEGGHAVAQALLGQLEPAGRLVTTFPSADGACPAWSVAPVDGHLPYTEGAYLGYRGYAAGSAPRPLFWFGHGLGYSSWEYGDARLRGDGSVAIEITNTGLRHSREVVQAYLRPDDEGQPLRLVGWASATVAPAATLEVTVSLDDRVLRRWQDGWQPVGDGDLLIGRSAGDLRSHVRWSRTAVSAAQSAKDERESSHAE
jgi:beta-glucosidase